MSKRILVIDDDEVMSEFVINRLQDAGFEVLTAVDGEEGLRIAKESKPDLLVLDLAMPKMHGYEVCKAIRADAELKGTKIVVTSGKNYAVDKRAAQEAGADRYLVKPYPVQELLEAVSGLLGLPPA